jgi:hypothetical protein
MPLIHCVGLLSAGCVFNVAYEGVVVSAASVISAHIRLSLWLEFTLVTGRIRLCRLPLVPPLCIVLIAGITVLTGSRNSRLLALAVFVSRQLFGLAQTDTL